MKIHIFKIHFLIGGFYFLINCSSDNNYTNVIHRDIPKEFWNYLPENLIESDFEFYVDKTPYYDNFVAYPITIYLTYNSDNSDSLVLLLKSNSIGKYNFSDECNIVLYRFQNGASKTSSHGKEWLYNDWLEKLDKNCNDERIPIPNFIDVGEELFKNKYGISDEFDIYPIEANSGKYFSEECYSKELMLPQKWRRGYSRGYAVNSKSGKVIYWLTIW